MTGAPGGWRQAWNGRARTLEAMVCLGWARFLVAVVPLRFWYRQDQASSSNGGDEAPPDDTLRHCAAALDRADHRLPGSAKCLPLALAMRTLLARRGYSSRLVIGIRPKDQRRGADDLHAWLTAGQRAIYGAREGNDRPVVQF